MYSIDGKRVVALFLFCLLIVFSHAAVFAGGDEEWRPVTAEELALKSPKVEPDADAEAIFWEVRIDDSSQSDLSLKNYVRVKIFTERGREKFSKFDIPFRKGLKIKDLAARVIRPDGSTVEIKKEDIFEREIIKAGNVKIKAKSFAVPNIEPGVIVEYRYKEAYEHAQAAGMHLAFQRDIPVETLSYFYKPFNEREPNYQSFNFGDTKFVKDEKKFYVATRTNIPAFKEESMMPPENQVTPWMLLQAVRVNITEAGIGSISYVIKDPSSPNRYWGAVAKEQSELVKFIIKKDKDISRAAADITAGATTPEEKTRKLYDFCQTQIKNTSFDFSMTDEQKSKLPKIKSVADVLKNKTASAGYVDMLFGAMANSLGFETRVAFSGDRSEMFFEPSMTNESFVHPAAIALKIGDDWKFYNPGTSYLPYGSLVWFEEDVWALLVGEVNSAWVKTPLTEADKSIAKRTGKFNLLEDGTLEGTVRVEYNGQLSLVRKAQNLDDSPTKQEESLRDEIKKRISTAEVSDIVIENSPDPEKPFAYSYKVRVPNYAQRTGKRLFVQPGFFEYGEEPVFSSAKRKYDVYFHYPWAERDTVEIRLPKNFALDSADTPAPLADPQKIGGLTIKMGTDKDQTFLSYDRDFHFGAVNALNFPVSAYQPLKNMFDAFHKADTHTITLKQK